MTRAPAFGSRLRDDWDANRAASERAGLRHVVHADTRRANRDRERDYANDLERAHSRGELDSRGERVDVPPAFGDWAFAVSSGLRGRKAIHDYADRAMRERLRGVAETVYGSAGDPAIIGECMKRAGASDLIAAAFLALEILDGGSSDAIRDCARSLYRAWDRVLDGRLVDLVDVGEAAAAVAVPVPVDAEPPTEYWDGVLASADSEYESETVTDWEPESWEIANIAGSPLTGGAFNVCAECAYGDSPRAVHVHAGCMADHLDGHAQDRRERERVRALTTGQQTGFDGFGRADLAPAVTPGDLLRTPEPIAAAQPVDSGGLWASQPGRLFD